MHGIHGDSLCPAYNRVDIWDAVTQIGNWDWEIRIDIRKYKEKHITWIRPQYLKVEAKVGVKEEMCQSLDSSWVVSPGEVGTEQAKGDEVHHARDVNVNL